MKVRYKTLAAGPDGVFRVGDMRDVDDATGNALVFGGYAEAVGVKSSASVLVAEIKQAVTPKEPEPQAKKPHKTTKK